MTDHEQDRPYPGTVGREEYDFMAQWTLEEALAAQRQWWEDNPDTLQGPLWWWVGIRHLEGLRYAYENGDGVALLDAVHVCAFRGLPMPAWCAQAFISGYRGVIHFKKRSWDAAFGTPHKKSTHLAANAKKHRLKMAVYMEVLAIRKREPGTAIDAQLFERVGKKFHVGKTLAEEYYYQAVKDMDGAMTDPIVQACNALLDSYVDR
jgi:hypothetical protein